MTNENVNLAIETYKVCNYDDFGKYERVPFLVKILTPYLEKSKSFLDIGCARGGFTYVLKKTFPQIAYTGVEYAQELIDMAKKEPTLSDVEFVCGDALDFDLHRGFDIALMAGVLSMFDDFTVPLANMIKHINQNGAGCVFGSFNPFDIDVLVRYKRNYAGCDRWESGFNNYSMKTISAFLEQHAYDIEWHQFKLKTDLPKNEDQIKSYTVRGEDGENIILSGTGMMTDFYALVFKKK